MKGPLKDKIKRLYGEGGGPPTKKAKAGKKKAKGAYNASLTIQSELMTAGRVEDLPSFS